MSGVRRQPSGRRIPSGAVVIVSIKRLIGIIAVVPAICVSAGLAAAAYGYAVTVGLKRGLFPEADRPPRETDD